MGRAFLIAAALVLAAPAAASAKTGFQFDNYPETAKVGEPIPFTVHVWRDAPADGGRARTARGIRPLLTFQSKSGRTVSVRAGRTDRFGTVHAQVAFPDKGPWTGVLHLKRYGVYVGSEGSQTFKVGTGLVETIPAATAASGGAHPGPADASRGADPGPGNTSSAGFPWVWVLALAGIASGLVVVAIRRRWGAA